MALPQSHRLVTLNLAAMLLAFSALPLVAQQDGARKWAGNGLQLEIAPLATDVVTAFFIGRDFSSKDARHVAETGCVFRSAIGNEGKSEKDAGIEIDLTKWRVIVDGRETPPMTRQVWADVWKKREVGETPAIAFHWALFPTRQQYNPTDYNWGLLTFALPPKTRFDLRVVWAQGSEIRKTTLENLECG
ncbi:hypothetical protein MNBD_ALPHA08-923 [hydrothermal vent metagenome]|uniref:Uncharacterized protein n=1 Tax=hydrothermal vent metagenome TaxID=652676 RepID=A0A3B0RT50_9ZZZZ